MRPNRRSPAGWVKEVDGWMLLLHSLTLSLSSCFFAPPTGMLLWLRREALTALDQRGYVVLDAIAYGEAPPAGSHATPHSFVCVDGAAYWVKAQAQQGLSAELIAGRLAAKVQAGPDARIIRVPAESLPADGSASHLKGFRVGSRDQAGIVNMRNVNLLGTPLKPESVRAADRARVVSFQTWLGVQDHQVGVVATSGQVLSLDHGDCFADLNSTDPQLVVADIPGVPADHGNSDSHVASAVEAIEAIGDDELLEAVSGVPTGADWNSEGDRRYAIAECLAARRDKLRDAMTQWPKN